jgi:transcriptional regulator with XRE-family HTH domain
MRIQERIGKRVREAREQARLTQEELGEAMAYEGQASLGHRWSKQTVSAAEAGKREFVAEELLVLALILEKPIWWFFGLGDTAADIADFDKVQLPNGFYLPERTIQNATGRQLQRTRHLAEQFEVLTRELRSVLEPETKE